ncbi:hypothetical protein GQ44DRAFT_809006 [Phaeosphaeriaceae sp. PMI808]|nr:hypothetical protein GQ44DRAFT_809006 [Phaeosphaeriaceae sp. PMI808]
MTSNWAQTQHEGWLCELYGKDRNDGTRKLPHESVQSQLIDTLDELLSGKYSSKDSATKTATLIMSQRDVDTPWNNLIGLYLNVVSSFANEKSLGALAGYIVELANLPDAVNEGPEAKISDVGGMELRIEPGQAIGIEVGKLWRDLPGFSWNLTENFQGPEMYLADLSSPVSPDEAKAKWKNLNTWLALIAKSPDAQKTPALTDMTRLGLKTLVMALEYSPDTQLGRNVELHVPAAMQWLQIAGDEIERLCNLWAGRGSGEICDSARFQYWRTRVAEFGY